jgi:hypothetical protein
MRWLFTGGVVAWLQSLGLEGDAPGSATTPSRSAKPIIHTSTGLVRKLVGKAIDDLRS